MTAVSIAPFSVAAHAFRLPPVIHYGPGSAGKVPEALVDLGVTRPFVVSGKNVLASPEIARLVSALRQEVSSLVIYDEMTGEPTSADVERGCTEFKASTCDCIIGLGGGSRIDAAKAIALVASSGKSCVEIEGVGKVRKRTVPLVAITTTAGTGTEVTAGAVITDPNRKKKMIIAGPSAIPDVAVDDPCLTTSMPPQVTANTGMDALIHAIEGYLTKRAQPLTNTLALDAIRLISHNLLRAYKDPYNVQARGEVLTGQMLAGMVISHTGTALIHGMGRPLGTYFGVAHGLANAILFPYIMEFTIPEASRQYTEILRCFPPELVEDLDIPVTSKNGAKIGKRFCSLLGIPPLDSLGISKEDFYRSVPQMAREAIESGAVANNPRVASNEQIVTLYTNVFRAG